jgi:hypothetical protein
MNVIDVKDIERGVHLIPKFGHQIGQTAKMKRVMEESRTTIALMTSDQDDELDANANARSTHGNMITVSRSTWLDVMPHYEDLFSNDWIDNHIYKSVW